MFGVTDAAGRLVEGYRYDAFGEQTVVKPGTGGEVTWSALDVVGGATAIGNAYLFTGRRYDAESGLYNYRSRYYDAGLGRFISRDSIGVWGDGSNLGNGYAYVANNPVNNVDPEGTWGKKYWNKLKQKTKKTVSTISSGLNSVFERTRATFSLMATTTNQWLSTAAKTLGNAVDNVVNKVAQIGQEIKQRIPQAIQSAFSGISPAAALAATMTVLANAQPIAPPPPPLPAPPAPPKSKVDSILGGLSNAWSSTKSGVSAGWDAVGNGVNQGLDVIEKWDPTIEVGGYFAGVIGVGGGCGVGLYSGFYCQGSQGVGWGMAGGADVSFGGPPCGQHTVGAAADVAWFGSTAQGNPETGEMSVAPGLGAGGGVFAFERFHTGCTGGLSWLRNLW